MKVSGGNRDGRWTWEAAKWWAEWRVDGIPVDGNRSGRNLTGCWVW